jgi:hypothetical protein
MDRNLKNFITYFIRFMFCSYCGTPWRWSQEWPKHVGAKNKRHIYLNNFICVHFVGLRVNDKFTLIYGMERKVSDYWLFHLQRVFETLGAPSEVCPCVFHGDQLYYIHLPWGWRQQVPPKRWYRYIYIITWRHVPSFLFRDFSEYQSSSYVRIELTKLFPCSRFSIEKLTVTQLVKILRIFWNPKVYYQLHKIPPLAAILSQQYPVHGQPLYLRSILILFCHLSLVLPIGLFSSGLATKTLRISLLCTLHMPRIQSLLEFLNYRILGNHPAPG